MCLVAKILTGKLPQEYVNPRCRYEALHLFGIYRQRQLVFFWLDLKVACCPLFL